MRLRVLAGLALTVGLVSSTAPVFAQAWRDYNYPDAGFAASFPAPPAITQGEYRTLAGPTVPAEIYTTSLEGVVYRVTVADFSKAGAAQASAIDDAVKAWSAGGTVKLNVEARVNRQYGRELSLAEPGGGQAMAAIFFFDGRLYQLEARTAPDAELRAGLSVRFVESLQFRGR